MKMAKLENKQLFLKTANRLFTRHRPALLAAMSCLFIYLLDAPLCAQAPIEIGPERVKITPKPVKPKGPSLIKPHWHSDRCGSCHKGQGDSPGPIAAEKIDQLCLECHNDQAAPMESHPIGRQLQDNSEFQRPEGWPLVGGKIGCLTCHNVVEACEKGKERSLSDPFFLRARWVGRKEKFCQNCHKARTYQKFSPHIMLSGSNDIIDVTGDQQAEENTCLFCHSQPMDPTVMKRTGESHLRTDEVTLCRSCHPSHQQFFRPGHIGITIPEHMAVYMYTREILGPKAKPDKALISRLKKSDVKPARLYFDAEGKITCSTCHNPHQEAVFSPESVLADNAMWLIGPYRIKSPTADKVMCANCHR